jgi:hypothetical protein
VDADGLCERHAKGVLPQLAQPHWYRLVGDDLRGQEQRAVEAMSPEARLVYERKQRKAQTRAARAARMANARAGIIERLMRDYEEYSAIAALMDNPPPRAA